VHQFHTLTHFGFAQIKGHAAVALAHLRTITGMTNQQAKTHCRDALALWRQRSTCEWTLDLNVRTTAGVTLAPRHVPQTVSTSPSTPSAPSNTRSDTPRRPSSRTPRSLGE
jgi:hypothetical protein